jgi:hypothetical protein
MSRGYEGRMKISHIATAVSVTATIAAIAASSSAQAAKPNGCKTLTGHLVASQTTSGCTSPTGICFSGTVTGDKLLAGTTQFIELDQAPSAGMPLTEPGTTVSFSGTLTFTTSCGTLMVRDLGVIDGARTSYTELERPVGGTGPFVNASGVFFITGTLNTNLTTMDGTISGQLCGLP